MEIPNPNGESIRPYARLLTMLGEQLIKNERIALAEIVKNSYDADASWVSISFDNFGPDYEIGPESKIIIEDDGYGMTFDTIKRHWLNPATPGKKIAKIENDTTPKGRKIQGEKGIGRFAVLKLGKKAKIVTRPIHSIDELTIDFDFSKYDDDFLKENGEEKEIFLSDLRIKVTSEPAKNILPTKLKFDTSKFRQPHGTRIEISNIKGYWDESKIEEVYKDLSRIQSTFHEGLTQDKDTQKVDEHNEFNYYIYTNGTELNFRNKYINELEELLNNSTVLKVENGKFDSKNEKFTFDLNENPIELSLNDPEIRGIKFFKNQFVKKSSLFPIELPTCGSFEFGFYIFDFNAKPPSRYALDKKQKDTIKEHRIYLYRDGIRVLPYGDQDDDWLRIDALRGTISAGEFLSNDQVVGFIKITQKENPLLKDKTNREGLIDTGKPHDDFLALIQTLLSYLRHKPYEKYLINQKDKKVVSLFKSDQVIQDIEAVKLAVKEDKNATALIEVAEKNYKTERQYLVQRAETTEDLAGVGLSVETASHDIQSIMEKAMTLIDAIVKKVQNSSYEIGQAFTDLTALRGMLGFIEAQLKDIQLLFKSSKQRRRDIRVLDIVEKVQRIYQSLLDKQQIDLQVINFGPPLVAKTTDAVLLQVLLNLFDNAIYWLDTVAVNPKKIEIRLDGSTGTLFFSDNGPGIRNDDANFIFEPFFSGKGDAGRGLGLYIARQLLERHEYSIDLADLKANQYLSGANFIISFAKE